MSGPRTRREMLAAAATALVAGCLESVETRAPTEQPPVESETSTEGFPPPEPDSETPHGPTPLAVEGDWPAFQRDAGNTGHAPGVAAVPENARPHWEFYTRVTAPAVAGSTLYACEFAGDRVVTARNAATGRLQWTAEIPHGQVGPAPAVDDDYIYELSYGMMHAFDRNGGAELWTHDPGRGPPGAPLVVDGTVYATNGSFTEWAATAFAVDAESGEELWSVELGKEASSPTYANGAVVVGTANGLYALSSDDGSESWTVDLDETVTTAPATADGIVYAVGDAGTVHAVAADDGTDRWSRSVDASGGVAVGDDALYVGCEDGLRALSLADGEEHWLFESRGPLGTPAADDGTVYVGSPAFDDRHVYAVDAGAGEERWRYRTDEQTISDYVIAGVSAPPVPVDGGLFVAAADGLHAFGPDE